MSRRLRPILAAFVVASVVNFLGVLYVYGPIAAADAPGDPLVPRPLGFALTMLLLVLFYDWVNRQMSHPIKAALTVAVSQMLLVDVDYVLSGERGVAAGAASAALLLVSWGAVGLVYTCMRKPG